MGSPSATAPSADTDERTQRELTRMLLVNGRYSGFAVILGAVLVGPVLMAPGMSTTYLYWLAYMCCFGVARMIAARHYLSPYEPASWRKSLFRYSALTILLSLGWLSLPQLFLHALTPTEQVFILIINI